ncbi:MAG: hypothetical protein U9R50_08980, partial [Campylobacterota bacterium]|nr:hypothetical protein [Campylobacterota bacterium]
TITKEFESSMHKRSSIFDDKVHKAVWDLHPQKAEGNYNCAECHTPNAKTQEEQHAGITCISCHSIKNVENHARANKNIYTTEPKTFYSAQAGRESEKVVYKQTTSWFGLNKTTVGSAYHDIDYTNESYYDGKMCMGCHSHKQNDHEFDVCRTEEAGAKDKKENCITCHMPKVDGTATTVRLSKQHTFHGFAGARVYPEMLAKYIDLDFKKSTNGFEVSVHNSAPHNLMTHPLRVVQLRATLIRETKESELKTYSFVRAIGHDAKPSLPWLATSVVKDTMIKANEKRVVSYDDTLQSGDKVKVVLGFYVVNPKVLKKLNLQDEKEFTKFTILKSQYFNVE